MRVTVLMAVRNGGEHLEPSLRSVLDQTFEDFELLVVDDASTDGSVAIVEALGDPRVRLLRNETNIGQAASLNRGLAEARGELVARLDHDDECARDRLERQVAVLDAEPQVVLVGSWMTLVDADGATIGSQRGRIRTRTEFLFWTLVSYVLIGHPSAVYRRDAALALSGYDAAMAPTEDKDLWRRMALAGHDARIVEEELVRYRIHESQLSQVNAELQQSNDRRSQESFLQALAAESVPARELRLLLSQRRGLWPGLQSGRGLACALSTLLAGADDRLALDETERRELREAVAERVIRSARGGASESVLRWGSTSPPLAAWALRELPPGKRAVAAGLYGAAYLAAPLLRGAALALELGATGLAAAPVPRGARNAARRSRLLRALYSRILGER